MTLRSNAFLADRKGEGPSLNTTLRLVILWTLIFTDVGIGAELLLTGHTEGFWQLSPLILLASNLVLLGCVWAFRRRVLVRALQTSMVLCLASGAIGLFLHYKAKLEFKLEMDPSLAGWKLFWQTVKGSAVPPVLAPAAMLQVGLLGLAYAYRNPELAESANSQPIPEPKT